MAQTYPTAVVITAQLAAWGIDPIPSGTSSSTSPTWMEWFDRVLWRLGSIYTDSSIVCFEGEIVVYKGNVVTT